MRRELKSDRRECNEQADDANRNLQQESCAIAKMTARCALYK